MPRVKVPVPIEKPQPMEPDRTSPVVETTPESLPPTTVITPNGYENTEPKPHSGQKWLIAGFAILLLILLAVMLSVMNDRNELKSQVNKLSNPSTSTSKDEAKELSGQIGQYFLLPSNETPTIFTVTDINKVKSQAFFRDAQNGDRVLIYSKTGQAILYRPSIKKIINASQVNLDGAASTSPTGTNSHLPATNP